MEILKDIQHVNIVKMHKIFYTHGKYQSDIIMNIIMDYIPMTINDVMNSFKKLKQPVYPLLVKLYAYQLLKALSYFHFKG